MKLTKLIRNKKNILKIIAAFFCASSILSCFALISCSSNSNIDPYDTLFSNGIDINNIVDTDTSNYTVDQYIDANFGSIFATNDWLSNNKKNIFKDLDSNLVELKSYNNEINSNFSDGTIILKVYLEKNNQNRSFDKIYDLKLSNFKKGFTIPNVKSNIDISSISEEYSKLTLDQFIDLYFKNTQFINQWLNDNKIYFFESDELINELSINLIELNKNKDESLSMKIEITNSYHDSSTQYLELTGFVIQQLPILKKSLNISSINPIYSQITSQEFIKKYLSTDDLANKWLSDNKNHFFPNTEDIDNIFIYLKNYVLRDDGSIDLSINIKNKYRDNNQTINLFGFIFNKLPEINYQISIASIDPYYATLTSDEFRQEYFGNLSDINNWLEQNKRYLFLDSVDLSNIHVEIKNISNIKINILNGTIQLDLIVSNDSWSTNKTIILIGFKKPDPLPTFINELDIKEIDYDLVNWTVDGFITNYWSSDSKINEWFKNYKHLLFDNYEPQDDLTIFYDSNISEVNFNSINGCINVTGLKISNKYLSEYCNFNLVGFSSSLPNINTSIDISSIDNLSQLSAQQFITNYFDTPTKINNWLSQYRNLIIVDSSVYPGVNINIKPNTNLSINSNNNSINLTIVASFNNLSEELNLTINGFWSIINLPTLKSNIDVSSIDSSYAQLTADDFKKKYFNDEISINLWLKNHKSYLFNENINDDSLEIVLSPNTNVNVVNTTIELNVNISNIDNLPTTGKLVLSNFKSNPVVIPLPTLKNNIDISLINSNYLDISMSKFVENNFANEQNINNWLSKYKNYFFDSSNLDLAQISLQIEPNSLLKASHSRDALSFNVVFSNGTDSQNDKLILTNFKSPTPPVTNPISPTPYSYTPHLDTQLPRMDISINTNDPNNITNQYQSANFVVTDPNTNNVSATLSGKIKVRGNSTSVYPKKPYRIKLDKKTSMLNLNYNNEFKDWVLLADWRDPSMLRNATGLYLGQFLYKDFGLYSSDFRQIEVYINNTYQGMYLLCEQNEVSTNRVNIDKPILNSSNLDIGYLLEMDAYADSEEPLFRFDLNYNNKAKLSPEDNPDKNIFQSLGVLSYSIKSKIYSNEQNKFISNYLENIYRICYKAIIENKYYEFNNDKTDIIESNNIKTTDECISRVLDIDSVVASLILQEIVCDWDLSNSSFYMSVDLSQFGDGKLKLQVPWDFDCAFGIRYPWNGTFIVQPKGLYAANSSNPWMVLLYKSKLIQTKIKDKWAEMISNNVFEKLIKYLDDCSTLYSQNYEINFNKWKNIGEYARQEYLKYSKLETTSYSPPELEYWNAVTGADIVPEATWKNVVSQLDAENYLKDWLKTRLTNLNNLWKK